MRIIPLGAEVEFQRGWKLLLGCLVGMIIGVHSIPFYTTGLFMESLQSEFGWSRAQVSLAPSITTFVLAFSAPIFGGLVDRFGSRPILVPCLLIYTALLASISLLQDSVIAFYLIFGMIAALGGGVSTPTFSKLVNRAFDRGRGSALGMTMIGPGIASLLTPTFLPWIIASYGWRAGYLTLAGIVLLASPLLLYLLKGGVALERVAPTDQPADGSSFAEALRSPTFYLVCLSFFLVALASAGLVVNFVPLMRDGGASIVTTSFYASTFGIFLIIGRLMSGVLFDHFFAPRLAAILMLVGGLGCLAFLYGGVCWAFVTALGIGLAFGAEIDLAGYLCARYFGFRAYGRVYGLLYASILVGSAISPPLYGFIRDQNGSYDAGLWMSVICFAASIILFCLMPAFPKLDLAPASSKMGTPNNSHI